MCMTEIHWIENNSYVSIHGKGHCNSQTPIDLFALHFHLFRHIKYQMPNRQMVRFYFLHYYIIIRYTVYISHVYTFLEFSLSIAK